MTTPVVIYLGPPDSELWVRSALPGFDVRLCLDERSVEAALPAATAILDAFMKVPFPAGRIASAPHLRVVVTATTGANHIDAETLEARRIPLLTLRGQHDLLRDLTPAAEHSWLLLMACARRVLAAFDDVRHGEWDRNRHPGVMLRGRTIGLIGCGRIGQWMARYAEAFGMRRLGYDPYIAPWPSSIERVTLERLLSDADFVSVHVPLTDDTRGMLGAREFALMKPGASFINTSRGEIVDEASLLDALTRGTLGAAGLDVLSAEPNVAGDPLVEYARSHPNLMITPHIGGYSPDALRQVLDFSCRRLRQALGGVGE